MAAVIQIALSILLVGGFGKAQIPEPCASATSFLRRECCPTPTNVGSNPGPCGMNLTPSRGECVGIPNGMINESNREPRQNWPTFFFTRVCNCTFNYGGYDCGECAFGYQGPNCSQRYTRQRRSISELTDQEWSTYITQLQMAKRSSSSRYRVITYPPDYNNLTTLRTQPIGVYNLFVWFHHYVAKDNDGNSPNENDYAHEATGFPTWHRLFLLWFEREMQIFLQDENFTLHYWDWRDLNQRRSLFQSNRLGEHNMVTSAVTGQLFDNDGWQTVCWYDGSGGVSRPEPHRICDPRENTGPLQRCPNKTTCEANYMGWPSYDDVQAAVNKQGYDISEYNKLSSGGFRNFLEGFQVVANCDNSIRGQDLCVEEAGIGLERLLHNTVHIILGIGNFRTNLESSERGVMGDVAASANDPIFIHHHAMVDCILEKWLQRNIRNEGYPTDQSIRAGHRRDDYIVPFIPLYTHNTMYQLAHNLGYTCDIPDPPTSPTGSAKSATALLYVLVLAIMVSATFILNF